MTTDRKQVLDPKTGSYVLPSPPRGHRDQLVTGAAEPAPAAGATAEVARALGARFQVQAESLDMFLGELRGRLEQLDAAIAEDTRMQLKGAVRDVGEVLEWCDAVQQEIAAESARAQEGQEPVELGALCEQVAGSLQDLADPISVVRADPVTCWGARGRVVHLLHKALDLVWARTSRQGLRSLEPCWQGGVPCVRVCSRGEPVQDVAPEAVDAFRAAVTAAGAVVVPDALGPGGAGFVLRLPR